jgi:hypothetical protein
MNIFLANNRPYENISFNDVAAQDRARHIIELITPKTPNLPLVRLGSERDGGYVMINDFSSQDTILSFGIENNIDIETELSKVVKEVHMYDGTIDGLPYTLDNGVFFKEMLSEKPGTGLADLKKAISRASGENIVIKCDIEGSEWKLFANAKIEDLRKVRQIVIEFHWTERILSDEFYGVVKNTLEKLYSTHQPVNVHENNYSRAHNFGEIILPSVLEVTYANRDYYSFSDYDSSKYYDLNKTNCKEGLDLFWSKPW